MRQKYLAIFLASLPPQRRAAFEAFLEEIKYSISYVKLDNRPLDPAAFPGQEPGESAGDECADLQARYAMIIGRGGDQNVQ